MAKTLGILAVLFLSLLSWFINIFVVLGAPLWLQIFNPIGLLMLVLLPLAFFKKGRRYLMGLWYSMDQFGNAILSRNPDHTISGQVGYEASKGSKTAKMLEKFINTIFFFQKNHCRRSIEKDRVDYDDKFYFLDKEDK